MTWKYRYRKQIIIGIILFFVIGLISTLVIYHILSDKEEEEEPVVFEKKEKKETEPTASKEEYKVDIKGEINMPGIYTLKENSRVIDVIELAGGLTEEANTSVINLSKKITDEMVIIIYSNREVENFEQTKEMEKILQEKCNQPDENSLINDACINGEPRETTPGITGKISINSATKEELMTLPGIGESKAKDIITYREQNGPFTTIEDIMKVSGIGENTFAQIKENITV